MCQAQDPETSGQGHKLMFNSKSCLFYDSDMQEKNMKWVGRYVDQYVVAY